MRIKLGKFRTVLALLCALQVLLLSMASVSSYLHYDLLHGEEEACLGLNDFPCDAHHDESSGDTSDQSSENECHDNSCSVSLFANGVTVGASESGVLSYLPVVVEEFVFEKNTVSIEKLENSIQARAPPHS